MIVSSKNVRHVNSLVRINKKNPLSAVKYQSYLGNIVFAFRVVDSLNSMPFDVVDAPSLQAFKSRLDEIWQDKKFFSLSLPIDTVTSVFLKVNIE